MLLFKVDDLARSGGVEAKRGSSAGRKAQIDIDALLKLAGGTTSKLAIQVSFGRTQDEERPCIRVFVADRRALYIFKGKKKKPRFFCIFCILFL